MKAYRRTLLQLAAASAVGSVRPRAAGAANEAADAARFIEQAGRELATLVGGARSAEEKRQRLQPFVDRVVDVDAVARFCLGRYWRAASPAQQAEYLRLFHGVLLTNVVSRMGDYQQTEVRVVIGQPDMREDGAHVPTVVERTGNPPARVVWVVQTSGVTSRVVDVIAEGTSLRLTVRSDYNSFLAQHGDSLDALLGALRRQSAQNGG